MRMVRELADRIHVLDCRRTVAAEYQPQKEGRCFVYRVIQGKSLGSLRPMMRTTSMLELAYTNTVAGHLLWKIGSFTSSTSPISGFIGKMLGITMS
jgi:hypothetical protein